MGRSICKGLYIAFVVPGRLSLSRTTNPEEDRSMEFSIKLAETEEEKRHALEMRYEVYVEEMLVFGDEADHERKILVDEHDSTARSLIA